MFTNYLVKIGKYILCHTFVQNSLTYDRQPKPETENWNIHVPKNWYTALHTKTMRMRKHRTSSNAGVHTTFQKPVNPTYQPHFGTWTRWTNLKKGSRHRLVCVRTCHELTQQRSIYFSHHELIACEVTSADFHGTQGFVFEGFGTWARDLHVLAGGNTKKASLAGINRDSESWTTDPYIIVWVAI